ncbi:hypothetical protein P7K49_031313 [Saguinus oedipus]|uniref:Uncharacterized protein n=1 Tax=Saguinus oedipus TaxID=9490 RepID=A0ABQ9TZ13_SAGOE|nr:hypothetical protein P7K49_031313 [Saguinus oedipus]
MPLSFSSHTSPRDVLMVVVDSRVLVKDSARLSLRGVHGVATGVDFKWLALPQAGVGAELRLEGEMTGYSPEVPTSSTESASGQSPAEGVGRPRTRWEGSPSRGPQRLRPHLLLPLTLQGEHVSVNRKLQ